MLSVTTTKQPYSSHGCINIVSGPRVRMGQQTLVAAARLAVALAGYSFEASPVRHRDDASVLADRPSVKLFRRQATMRGLEWVHIFATARSGRFSSATYKPLLKNYKFPRFLDLS